MSIGSTLAVAKNAVTSKAGRQLLKTQKHSPVILFGAGVVGVVTTTVLASKATLKLDDVLSVHEAKQEKAKTLLAEDREDYTAKDYTQDMAKLRVRLILDVAKLYGPAIVVGTASIAALTGSHVILTKRNTQIMAAYAALDKAHDEYRRRVIEEFGEEKERELRHGVETLTVDDVDEKGKPIQKETKVSSGRSIYSKLFSRDTTSNWSPQPEYNVVFLRAQERWANDRLQARGHLFLNEVYDDLGLERTKEGAVVGWVYNNKRGGDNFVSFGVFDGEDPIGFNDFLINREGIWLDFNVDGIVYDLI